MGSRAKVVSGPILRPIKGHEQMAEGKAVEFEADDGSVIRACDFGPEFDERYLTLPDLEQLERTVIENVYFIPSRSMLVVRRDHECQ